jgi:hypothetical protein
MLPVHTFQATLGKGPRVTLSGQTLTSTGTGGSSAYAAFRFNTDGTIDQYRSHGVDAGVYTQIDAGTDWIIPNSAAANKTYSVRVQATPPTDDFTTKPSGASTNGTWVDLTGGSGANREWGIEDTDPDIGTTKDTGNFTFELSDDGGSTVIASNTYSLSANWRGP